MTFADLVHAVHDRLDELGVEHALGGALALIQYAEPRGTKDIDIGVAVSFEDLPPVVDGMRSVGLTAENPSTDWLPVAGVRLLHDASPYVVDLFAAIDDEYDEIFERVTLRPFTGPDDLLPYLSAEDLAAFKLTFNRPKDWVDIEAMLTAGTTLDVAYIERKVVALRGRTIHPRVARLRTLVRATGPTGHPT